MPFTELNTISHKEIIPGYKVRFVHAESMTLAFWEVEEGAKLPKHKHVHEQVSIVTKGEFELTIDGKSQILKPGMVATIPSNTLHSARAITYCEIIDSFSPVREDYK